MRTRLAFLFDKKASDKTTSKLKKIIIANHTTFFSIKILTNKIVKIMAVYNSCYCFKDVFLFERTKKMNKSGLFNAKNKIAKLLHKSKFEDSKVLRYDVLLNIAYDALKDLLDGIICMVKHECEEFQELSKLIKELTDRESSARASKSFFQYNQESTHSQALESRDEESSFGSQNSNNHEMEGSNYLKLDKIIKHKHQNKELIFTFKWKNQSKITRGRIDIAKKYPRQLKNYLDSLEINYNRQYRFLKDKYPELFAIKLYNR